MVGAASFSVDSHLLDRRLMSATVALHAELLHEQAVLYAVFLYSLITHDNFLSLNFKFLFAVKIAWGGGVVLNIECCIST